MESSMSDSTVEQPPVEPSPAPPASSSEQPRRRNLFAAILHPLPPSDLEAP